MAKPADDKQAEIAAIRSSGLFLSEWYLARRRPAVDQGGDGAADFCRAGWREGASPNPYFSTEFYLAQNPDVRAAGINPLLHYIACGEAEGRAPCPFFDPLWYRATYNIAPPTLCLRHFLERRFTGQVNPVPVFDAAYYLDNNPDVAAGGADPFEHFLCFGWNEGRNPAAAFDVKFYLNRYKAALHGMNPLLHYLAHRQFGGVFPSRPPQEQLVPGAIRQANRPSPYFEEVRALPPAARPRAKLLAYYLPQFHRVPENDAWWGKGFTDWTNLARAAPRFVGHLQPRAPRDLGYYSLDDPGTLPRQIALAKGAGLFGFVFYFYWFNRHRLLEQPLEQLLADAGIDFPFCVMWANENWTRRWDGLEREVLIAQEYRDSDDAALVAAFARLFKDRRYIRVQGRPLLMIYRIDLVPNARSRLKTWRQMFRDAHGEEPLIVMAQSLGDYDPEPYGLDGAVEFPPHKLSQRARPINDELDLLDAEFDAAVFRYEQIAKISLAMPEPDYPLIKTVVPGWDNDPRREGKGLVLHGATPKLYQAWLEKLVTHAERNPFFGEPLLCVNAWNEWAEGAFLEPDIHFGGAFLNATASALCPDARRDTAGAVLLVGHDAQPHGAQMLLLHLARHYQRQWGLQVQLLLLGVGPLMSRYEACATVTVAYDRTIIGNHVERFREAGIRTAIVNSAASARVVPQLAARGIAATLLIHEMPRLLKEHNLEVQAKLGGGTAARLVFSSDFVRRQFCAAVDLPEARGSILPQGNYQNIVFDAAARRAARKRLGIADEAFLVLGVGFADLRKGFDLFLQMARGLAGRRRDVHCLWVGEIHFDLKTYLGPEMEQAIAAGRFHHIGFTDTVAQYFAAADVYALTSREDPYPTVVLEALACGVPCVAFDDTGGIPELLRGRGAGRVSRPSDVADFTAQVEALLDHAALRAARPRLVKMAQASFGFTGYAAALLRLAQPGLRGVSACVLNYNYARYLPGRLNTVFGQTYPVQEVLFFDDASTDGSVAAATALAAAAGRDMTVLTNPQNSGSAFAQWRRAVEAASGEFIWIAEADDECAPDFLQALMRVLAEAEAEAKAGAPLLAFTDSKAVGEDGAPVMASYQGYYLQSGAAALTASGVWPADEFARRFLTERNLIPNVSAVLWRREALRMALRRCEDLADWRVAGDWRLYLELLAGAAGSVVYVAAPLNTHRRHEAGVTQRLDAPAHAAEIGRIHAIAAERLRLDTAGRAGQERYLELIKVQFGLQPKPKAKLGRNPAKATNAGAAILATPGKV